MYCVHSHRDNYECSVVFYSNFDAPLKLHAHIFLISCDSFKVGISEKLYIPVLAGFDEGRIKLVHIV